MPLDDILLYTAKYLRLEERSCAKDHSSTIQQLLDLQQEQQQQRNAFETIIQKYDKEIQTIWDCDSMKKHKYILHSIIVKKPETSTYQTYIFNHDESTWYKYCNRTVFAIPNDEIDELFSIQKRFEKYAEIPQFFIYIDANFNEFNNLPLSNDEILDLLPVHLNHKVRRKQMRRQEREKYSSSPSSSSNTTTTTSSINTSQISNEEIIGRLEHEMNEYMENFKPYDTPNLSDFGYFLLSLQKIDLLQQYIAEKVYMDAFGNPLASNPHFIRLLQHNSSIPRDTIEYHQYEKVYHACVEILQFFIGGILQYQDEEFVDLLFYILFRFSNFYFKIGIKKLYFGCILL